MLKRFETVRLDKQRNNIRLFFTREKTSFNADLHEKPFYLIFDYQQTFDFHSLQPSELLNYTNCGVWSNE